MAKRKIVKIDESKCTGCGECIPNCHEGALQIIDGKARLVKDIYCDGLGACLGHCPEGAISIEEREAKEFNEEAVKKHKKSRGRSCAFPQKKAKLPCGCPGTMTRSIERKIQPKLKSSSKQESMLTNWPVQLMLVPVEAPYLKNSDLLISADCVPFSYADFHNNLLLNKVLVVGCPKLDAATIYEEKLSEMIKLNNIRTITVAHMEVPCCFGLIHIVKEAIRLSGKNVPMKEVTISIRGERK